MGHIFLTQSANNGVGVENLASTQEEFFAYYEPDSGKSFRKAIVDLQNYVSAEGPFDGIIAFSQGTSLAAALLLELQNDAANREGSRPQPLSFAVFFSGRLPFIDAGIKDALSIFSKKDTLINIPTAHIWGARDDLEPGQPQALTELCKADDMVTFVHQGGHEIPGSGSHEALTESVHAIRRALDGINK